jgi:endonuclease/exonuclease/phosphatase (EEP) superfamily protein YafD
MPRILSNPPSSVVRAAHRARGIAVCACLVSLLAGCVAVTSHPRAVFLEAEGTDRVARLECTEATPRTRDLQDAAARQVPAAPTGHLPDAAATQGLDPARIRIVSWNIHKQSDAGWEGDLAQFARDADLLLLQELVLRPDLRRLLEATGLRWAMASSFFNGDLDIGVLTAARVAPTAVCTQRVVEPLLRLPKSALVTWYPIKNSADRLAVANMHSINFSLSLGTYRAQLAAMQDVLARHHGPILFAGDLNTWTAGRYDAVRDMARALGLTEIRFDDDRRRLFLGRQLDHVFVRGLTLAAASTIEVTSSDHNPVLADLRFAAVQSP